MSYKLIAIDMDGTLLNSDKKVSKETKDVLNQIKAKGIEIVIATGRLYKSADHYRKQLGFTSPIITSNGSYVIDEYGGIIYENILSNKALEKIVELGDKYNIYNHFYTSEKFYSKEISKDVLKFYSEGNENIKIGVDLFTDVSDLIKEDIKIHKAIFVDRKNQAGLKKLKKELETFKDLSITSSWSDNVEVMGKGVSKGQALMEVCKYKNISIEDTIAIGDNLNDIPMLQVSGLSIAMGNAEDKVKKIANYTTESNDQDGLAKILKKII